MYEQVVGPQSDAFKVGVRGCPSLTSQVYQNFNPSILLFNRFWNQHVSLGAEMANTNLIDNINNGHM